MEEKLYIVFGLIKGKSTGNISTIIHTNETDYNIVWDLVNKMNTLFPLYDWDCSNADWTRRR